MTAVNDYYLLWQLRARSMGGCERMRDGLVSRDDSLCRVAALVLQKKANWGPLPPCLVSKAAVVEWLGRLAEQVVAEALAERNKEGEKD